MITGRPRRRARGASTGRRTTRRYRAPSPRAASAGGRARPRPSCGRSGGGRERLARVERLLLGDRAVRADEREAEPDEPRRRDEGRRRGARRLGHEGGEVRERVPVTAEDVVLARATAAFGGEQAVHDVAHVDEVEAAGDHGGERPAPYLQDHLAEPRRREVVRPHDGGRVDDDRVEAVGDDGPQLHLARRLREIVGARRRQGGARGGLVDGARVIADEKSVDGARVHHPAHARGARGPGDGTHPADVRVCDDASAIAADGDDRGEVKDDLRARQRDAHGRLVADVGDDALDVEPRERRGVRPMVPDDHAHRVAAVEQRPHQIAAQVSRCARHHGGQRRALDGPGYRQDRRAV